MNILRLFLIPMLVLAIGSCSTRNTKNDSCIHFENTKYNFNELPYKREAVYSFKFTNPGKSPLVIFDVKTSCGCTVPEWTKKPVKPNDSGEIKIKYEADFPGMFHKEISVYFNGKDSPAKLTIKGQVEYPADLEEEIK
nr:DUF1573 domain-containing protein [uncultured Draconibacterium sp.]